MVNLRAKAAMAVATAIVTVVSIIGVLGSTTAPASAADPCPFLGTIKNGSHYLDDYGQGFQANVHTYPETGSFNQAWCVEPASGGGMYIHPLTDEGLCLDLHTYTSGQTVWMYTCNGTLPQRWCWDFFGYIVAKGNRSLALRDRGLYQTVAAFRGGNNTWLFSDPHYVQPC